MKTALGIDIGGTKISVTLGNLRGKILAQKIIPTQKGARTGKCVGELLAALKTLREASPMSIA